MLLEIFYPGFIRDQLSGNELKYRETSFYGQHLFGKSHPLSLTAIYESSPWECLKDFTIKIESIENLSDYISSKLVSSFRQELNCSLHSLMHDYESKIFTCDGRVVTSG